jgi:hypothetical protein
MATFASVFESAWRAERLGDYHGANYTSKTAWPWELQVGGDLYFRTVQVLATGARLVIYRGNDLLDD